MKFFYFDTSYLVALTSAGHPFHAKSSAWMQTLVPGGWKGVISGHVLAEYYATLTHYRYDFAIPPETCARVIEKDLAAKLAIEPLTKAHYLAALRRCAGLGLGRAVIYDALHVEAAITARCEALVTLNAGDFTRLIQGGRPRVIVPGSPI